MWLVVHSHDLTSRASSDALWRLWHVQLARWWFLFFWSSVIFSAAYCLLLGGIKLCVGAVGLLWRRRMEEGWRDGGRGGIFLCDMGHWLFFHSSGTIMRFFFLFFRISVPPFSALIVFMKLCIHLSMLEQGKESYFQNISKLFSVIVQRLIRVCVV